MTKIIEFWILEDVIDEGDWDCSKLRFFRSYEKLLEFCRNYINEGEEEILDIVIEDCYDKDGYYRSLVYDEKNDEDPWFIIHKGSLIEES